MDGLAEEAAEDPMRTRLAFALLVPLVAGCLAAAWAAAPETAPAPEPSRLLVDEHPFEAAAKAPPRIVLAPIARVDRIDGALLYGAYCAQCHGEQGRADGPLAAHLGVAVPDLTGLADERGAFDRRAVRAAVARRAMVPHADAEPWRDVLADSYGDRTAERMLNALVRYVETLQTPR